MAEVETALSKTERIHLAGIEALKEGNVPMCNPTAMIESIRNRYGAYLVADEVPSMVRSMFTYLEGMGMKFFMAGRDYPFHITLEEGKAAALDADPFSSLANDPVFELLEKEIPGRVVLDTLILDKGNLLVAASEIPDGILNMRERLSIAYRAYRLEPLRIQNLLHATVSRIVEFGVELYAPPVDYMKAMICLREDIKVNPVVLEGLSLWHGPAADFLSIHPAP